MSLFLSRSWTYWSRWSLASRGTRPDRQVSVAAAVGGHDDGPRRRRAVAGGDVIPGGRRLDSRPASGRTDHQLQPVRDRQLRGGQDDGCPSLPSRPPGRDRAGRFRQAAHDRDELDCPIGCERLAEGSARAQHGGVRLGSRYITGQFGGDVLAEPGPHDR